MEHCFASSFLKLTFMAYIVLFCKRPFEGSFSKYLYHKAFAKKQLFYLQGTFTISLMFLCERQNVFTSHLLHIWLERLTAGLVTNILFSHTGVLIFNDWDHFKLHKDKYNYILAQSVCQMGIWCVQTLCGIQRWCTWEFNVTLTDGSALASSRIYLEVQHTCTHTLKHLMSCKNVEKI